MEGDKTHLNKRKQPPGREKLRRKGGPLKQKRDCGEIQSVDGNKKRPSSQQDQGDWGCKVGNRVGT